MEHFSLPGVDASHVYEGAWALDKVKTWCLASTETMRLIRDGERGEGGMEVGGRGRLYIPIATLTVTGFQARSKDQEILEEGGGAGPSNLHRRDHE